MPSQETTNAVTAHDIESLKMHIRALEEKVETMAKERDNALRWGLVTLGAAVLTMGGWIFNLVTGHIK